MRTLDVILGATREGRPTLTKNSRKKLRSSDLSEFFINEGEKVLNINYLAIANYQELAVMEYLHKVEAVTQWVNDKLYAPVLPLYVQRIAGFLLFSQSFANTKLAFQPQSLFSISTGIIGAALFSYPSSAISNRKSLETVYDCLTKKAEYSDFEIKFTPKGFESYSDFHEDLPSIIENFSFLGSEDSVN